MFSWCQGGISVTVFFLCASVVSYVVFVLSLFVPHLSFLWCHGRAVLRDCGMFPGIFAYISQLSILNAIPKHCCLWQNDRNIAENLNTDFMLDRLKSIGMSMMALYRNFVHAGAHECISFYFKYSNFSPHTCKFFLRLLKKYAQDFHETLFVPNEQNGRYCSTTPFY